MDARLARKSRRKRPGPFAALSDLHLARSESTGRKQNLALGFKAKIRFCHCKAWKRLWCLSSHHSTGVLFAAFPPNKQKPTPKTTGLLETSPRMAAFFSSSFARAGILSAVRDWWRAHPHAGALQPLLLLLGVPTGVPGSCWGPGQLCTWQEGIQGGGSKSSASMPKSLKTHELGSI